MGYQRQRIADGDKSQRTALVGIFLDLVIQLPEVEQLD